VDSTEFTTNISRVAPGEISIRGYSIESIISSASYGQVIFLLITGRQPTTAEARVFDAILASCADHGLVNTAAVTTRYAMSGSGNLISSMAAGLLSFGKHTGMAHLTAEMLLGIENATQAGGEKPELIDKYLKELRTKGLAVPGFGHPLHKSRDPREFAVREVAMSSGLSMPYLDLLDQVQSRLKVVIGKSLVLNVDGLMAALLLDLGFSAEESLAVNMIGSMPGLAAHALEESRSGQRLRFVPSERVHYLQVKNDEWPTQETTR